MSIQLTVYPQNYNGYSSGTTTTFLNELAEPSTFMTLAFNAIGFQTTQPADALNTNAPIAGWEKFCTPGLTYPSAVLDLFAMEMYMVFGGGNGVTNVAGTYFKLTGLVPGQNYEVLVDVAHPQAYNADINQLYLGINGSANVTTTPVCGGSGTPMVLIAGTDTAGWTTPVTFTAQNTDETLCLTFFSQGDPAYPINPLTTNYNLCLRTIHVRKATKFELYDGQIICDLYNEEEIPLTLSVDSFEKAGEKQQSYSKAFKLPATKHNNDIFENLFELTRDSWARPSWSPYKQTRAVYKEDGHVIFSGFLKLIDVSEKDNEISYNVNLYSESVALASLMKQEKFADLNFDELAHNYNRQVVQNSWNGALNLLSPLPLDTLAGTPGATDTNVLKYPTCNWNGQILEQATAGQIGNGATTGMPSIENLQTMFRPWIRIKYLIDKIFKKHGFIYESSFFDSAYFGRLFMDFNWGKEINWTERTQIGSVDFSSGAPAQTFTAGTYTKVILSDNNTFITAGYDTTTGQFTAPATGTKYDLTARIKLTNNTGTDATVQVYWRHTVNATAVTTSYDLMTLQVPASQTRVFNISTAAITVAAVNIALYDTLDVIVHPTLSDVDLVGTGGGSTIAGSISGSTIIASTLLNTKRGKLKQWDFFKGIMDMFNLVTIQSPNNPKKLIIEPYNDIYGPNNTAIVTHDWTNKVDASEMKFKPMNLKQTTTFQYQKDKDYPFAVYEGATNGYLYGSLEWTVPGYTEVRGTTKIEAKPFASTIIKPFFDTIMDWPGPCIYKGNADETAFEGIENKPRILYDVTGDVGSPMNPGGGTPMPGGYTYYIQYQNGMSGTNQNTFCLFSHTDAYPSTFGDRDLNFGPCQLIGIGVPPTDNLFSRYYQDYYYELYHPDTKSIKLKILLTATEVNQFKFWDKIMIKNRTYRVSKINYKPKQLSDVELLLIP